VAKGDLTRSEKDAVVKRIDERLVAVQRELRTFEGAIGTKQDAIQYAVNYIGQAARLWANASPDERLIFQRMVYPDGVPYDFATGQFGTAKMSLLYTVVNTKKDPSESEESHLVNLVQSNWNHILEEINGWYDVLYKLYSVNTHPRREMNQAA
jgi:hypothetical protein